MFVLTEASDPARPAAIRQDLEATTAIAQLLGFPVYLIPSDDSRCGHADHALAHIPPQSPPVPAVWLGFIPSPEHYQEIYTAAFGKGVYLLNTPAEHQQVLEFDRAYGALAGLTPESVILTHPDQCSQVPAEWGFPVCVRGAVQPRKARGWYACVAHNRDELRGLVEQVLTAHEAQERGRVLVRRLVSLRHSRTAPTGFPLGREFRVLLYRQQPISYGYIWEGDDPDKFLSVAEEAAMLGCAIAAAHRLPTPFVALHLGQQTDHTWTVLETGDPQFIALTQLPLIQFWQQLAHCLEATVPKSGMKMSEG